MEIVDPGTYDPLELAVRLAMADSPETETISAKFFTASHQSQVWGPAILRVDTFMKAPETKFTRKYTTYSFSSSPGSNNVSRSTL